MRGFAASGLVAVASVALLGAALAQPFPGGPPGAQPPAAQVQACIRLESELARLDRGLGTDPQAMRGLEDAIGKQRFELDRITGQAIRMGCNQRPGFFLFGGGGDRPPQCDGLERQMAQMRQNLDRMMNELGRMRGPGGGPERDFQRRQIIGLLAQNNCGPQYRSAGPPPQQRPQNFFEQLFGRLINPDDEYLDVPAVNTFRTLCVRTCDGFYFPISFAATPSKFREDERICRALCPSSEVVLYSHRNPGEDTAQALSIGGRPYTELPNAFKYRQSYNPACACKAPNQTWAEALAHLEDRTVQRGDIIVTEERSRALQQGLDASQRGRQQQSRQQQQRGAPPQPAALPPPVEPAPPSPELRMTAPPAATDGKRQVRIVGPNFYPIR